MKKIQEIAKNFNLFTEEQIPQTHMAYFKERLKGNNNKVNEFIAKMTESAVFYHCQKDTNYSGETTFYIGNVYSLYLHGDTLLMLVSDQSTKKSYLFPYYAHLHKYHSLSGYKRSEISKSIKSPNKIGVFSERKVQEHFSYCDEYIAAMDAALNQLNETNAKHEAYLEQYKKDMKAQGATINDFKNGCYIDTKLFTVELNLLYSENYLEKKVRFKGQIEDILKITELINLTTL